MNQSTHVIRAPFPTAVLLAALVTLAACGETEVVENLHLRISSEAPTGGGTLESFGILMVKGGTRYPANPADAAFNPSLTGLDPSREAVLVSLAYDGQTFGGGEGVTLQVVGKIGQVVRTRYEGTIDLGSDKIIEVRLTNFPETCDGDGDGFLDCSNPACCPADSPFGDCNDGSIASNPWAAAPACISCDSTVDFDCDGQAEACVDADNDTVADCEETCGAGDPVVGPGLPELCDDKDNDCDGETDEGFELAGQAIGQACTAPGNCGAGVVECRTTSTVVCSSSPEGSNSQATSEVCDNSDNDCDGTTDEGFDYDGIAIGQACEGRGECGAGTVECAIFRTDLATCSTNPDGTEHLISDETCNDLDDDCDGDTDEGLTAAESDCLKVGVCTTGVSATCTEGAFVCDYSGVANYQATETLCDGLDNDCDGETDEGFLYEGVAIGESCDGVGACGVGVVECEDGRTDRATCSSNPGGSDFLAGGEICDGLDNDCDGDVDEGFSYLGANIGEACDGRGFCGAGTVVCAVGRTDLATCSTNPDGPASEATAETCNNRDDDCDGNLDDGLGLSDSPCTVVGVCAAAQGQIVATCTAGEWTCNYAAVPEYQANETRCDSRDNDCDGQTDEGYTYLGQNIGQSCDGIGACGAGTVQCAVGREDLATCSTNPNGAASGASTEQCDSLDNDCDHQTDEGFLYEGAAVGQACNGIGVCGVGLVECRTTSTTTCSTNPDGSDPEDGPEVCDTLDNDCDTQTDEGLTIADSTCTRVGVCASGLANIVATCTAEGTWTCDYSAVSGYQATEVACDALDNDCDGQTDEPFKAGGTVTYTDPQYPANTGLLLGASCGTGRCAGGTVICNASNNLTMVCDLVVQNRRTEVCDDIDDDCDGATDETFTELMTALDPGDIGLAKGQACGAGDCAGGTVVCNVAGTALTCNSEGNATVEVCDGGDEDCDSNIDEGFANIDGDGFADCVDPCIDVDFDTICSNVELPLCVGGDVTECRDNCPEFGNSNQADQDRDGKGDACDTCPAGPGPFEVCGDCLDNNCSGGVDEATCAERRIITIAAKGEALPAGYPVKLVLDHKTLVDAGWSTTSGDDVRIFYRDPTLQCDDADPLSCSVELDRVADPLAPFNTHTTEVWFALQAPLPANTATTHYEVYYNVDSLLLPLEDETAIFHMADLFEREDSNTLGMGWVEANQAASDFAIANGELNANYSGDGSFTPLITKAFDPISATSDIGRFELRLGYDWIRSNEGSWAVIMQLGKASAFAAMPSADNAWPNEGVGVSLAHGGGNSMGGQAVNTLASVVGGIGAPASFSSRATLTTTAEIYVTIDFREATPGWQVSTGPVATEDTLIAFTTAQAELDSLRFILNGVSNGFSSKSWRHILLRPALDPDDEPSVFLGIEEELGSGQASCTLASATLKYRMNGQNAAPVTTNALDVGTGTAIPLFRNQEGGNPVFIESLSHSAARFGFRGSNGRYLSGTQDATSKLQSQLHGRTQVTWEVVVDNNDPTTTGTTPYWIALAADGLHISSVGLAFINSTTVHAVVRTGLASTSTWTWNVTPLAQSRRAVLHLVYDSTRGSNSERLRLYYDGSLRAAASTQSIPQNGTVYIYSGSGNSPANQALFAIGNATGTNPGRGPLADIYWFSSYPSALSVDDIRKHTRILLKSDDVP